MAYNLEELYKLQPVYNLINFEINNADYADGISGTKRGVHQQTGEVYFFKPFLLREFIAGPLYKSFLGEHTSTQGLAFEINNGEKNFYIYSKSLGNTVTRYELSERNILDNEKRGNISISEKKEMSSALVESEEEKEESLSFMQILYQKFLCILNIINAKEYLAQEEKQSVKSDISVESNKDLKSMPSNYEDQRWIEAMKEDELIPLNHLSIEECAKISALNKIAVSFILFNESDCNPANILVACKKNAEGEKTFVSYKIDHGLSLALPCNLLSIEGLYCITDRALCTVGKFNNVDYEQLATSLSEGCDFLNELSDDNCEKFNKFLNTQFRFLYDKGVFQTKEECMNALKQFKIIHSIGIGKSVKLYEEFLEEHLKVLSLLSDSINTSAVDKMNRDLECHDLDKNLCHPLFIAIYQRMNIEGKNPIKWYEENKPEVLKQLLKAYECVKDKASEDNVLIDMRSPAISVIDAAILSSGIDLKKYNSSLAKQIEPEYEDLLAGCDELFDDSARNDLQPDAVYQSDLFAGYISEIDLSDILITHQPLECGAIAAL